MFGAMPWGADVVAEVMRKCCLFMPFQKAIGGISGYFVVSFTPQALALVERNQKSPSWAIPRQLKIAAPVDPKRPLSGERTVNVGPIYDPAENRMLGGVINTYSILAFAETTFGLLRAERRIGPVAEMNRRSAANRQAINDWISGQSLLQLGVADAAHRGAAVTLLKVSDPGITDAGLHNRIIARSKQLLGPEGITHPNGEHEHGLDVARYVNAFPGTPGDYRAWIGGIRPVEDITALLESLAYGYHRGKIVVLEEELAKAGVTFAASAAGGGRARKDDPNRAYKVLIADLVGLKHDRSGVPDPSAVKAHIEAKGGTFHSGPLDAAARLAPGIHFFYQPDLSTEAEILPATDKGQYDALICAATFIPKASVFPLGGVRIGAGTGNMGSASWGGGNGDGGEAPLMNTPSFNSRATAQMAFKALLKVMPDLPVDLLHTRVCKGDFDTGRNLREFPTEKLEGKKLAVIGYGNIGREMARIATAFGMRVAIHAREKHREWILSEGYEHAATAEDAARGADVITPHTGLGALDAATGRYANAGLLGETILSAMNDGAIVINYDRGEIVDCAALDRALASGKVRYAAVDADLFKDAGSGKLSGPMVPYLALADRYPGRLELLPHAAADTEHWSRVEGAKQAVDQIFDCIQHRIVTNLKGSLPEGYASGGARTVAGVGKASAGELTRAVADDAALHDARASAESLAAIWGALSSTTDPGRRAELIARHGASLVMAFNRHATLMRRLGLEGPYT
jgi:lactate dehydrogenase-like 2-hydroxyacid dehydrogenase